MALRLLSQGAEARIYETTFLGQPCVVKERFAKTYRHADLDRQLRTKQVASELRSILRCSRAGVRVPTLLWVDRPAARLYMQRIDGITVKEWLRAREGDFGTPECAWLARELGRVIATVHREAGMVHGDLTTSNFMVEAGTQALFVLDFGLAQMTTLEEDFAVDLYVLERAMVSTHPKSEGLFLDVLRNYSAHWGGGASVVHRLNEVRQRGRKKIAFG